MASTKKTDNIQLNQWVKTDPVLMDDMNADNQKIDSAITALQNGAVKVAFGTYTGTGTYNSGSPNTLSFDFEPKVIIIRGDSCSGEYAVYGVVAFRPQTVAYLDNKGLTGYSISLTWLGNSVSWYAKKDAGAQLNESDEPYFYMAFG